jgi:hypothetical protein
MKSPIIMSKKSEKIEGKKHTRCEFNSHLGRFTGPKKNVKLYESSFVLDTPID